MGRDDGILILKARLTHRVLRELRWVFIVYWSQGFDFNEEADYLKDIHKMRTSGTLCLFGTAKNAMEYAEKLNLREAQYITEEGVWTTEQGICGPIELQEILQLTDSELDKINPVWEEEEEYEQSFGEEKEILEFGDCTWAEFLDHHG